MLVTLAGCPAPEVPGPVLAMREAVNIVEGNRARLPAGLKATGGASGHFRDESGARRHFNLDARLQLVPPSHMRFVLDNILGGTELEVGMNADKWWLVVHRPRTQYFQAPHTSGPVRVANHVPLEPDQLIEALGLNPIPAGAAQRIVDDTQQLVYVTTVDDHRRIEKEYWLDRFRPRLVRRVLFRDEQGRVIFESSLEGLAPLRPDGGLLPHRLVLRWPMDDARMVFRVRRWQASGNLTPRHRAFVSPHDRGLTFEQQTIVKD